VFEGLIEYALAVSPKTLLALIVCAVRSKEKKSYGGYD